MRTETRQTWNIFFQHLRQYRMKAVLLFVSVSLAVGVEIVVPLFFKRFFDLLSGGGSAEQLVQILVFIVLLNAVVWVLWRIVTFGSDALVSRVMADLEKTSFSYLHRHSYGFFINTFVGSLVRKVSRFVRAFNVVFNKMLYDLVPMAVRIAAILAVLFVRMPKIAWVVLAWIVVYLIINYFFSLFKLKYDTQKARMDTQVTARLSDTLTNNSNIKLFSALGREIQSFARLLESQFFARKRALNVTSAIDSLQAIFMIALEFGVLYMAVSLWEKGLLTIGDFVLIQVYLLQIFNRLWDFARIIRDLYEQFADAKEMVEILTAPHAVCDKPSAVPLVVRRGEIKFSGVTFGYPAPEGRQFSHSRDILRNFTLRIAPGEKVGIVGPSGSGKTTLVALLFRFWDVDKGDITIDGTNIADATQDSLRAALSFVPQDPILFHRSLFENIRYGKPGASDEEVRQAAHLAHCDEFIARLPEGYDTYVGERGVKLSGGERQRVAIARALLKDAPILVLDEATSSLDSHSEKLIQDALDQLMQGRTTLVIAHRLSTIMRMDRIIVMRDGSVAEEGTHEELLKRNGVYRHLWNLQAGGFLAE